MIREISSDDENNLIELTPTFSIVILLWNAKENVLKFLDY